MITGQFVKKFEDLPSNGGKRMEIGWRVLRFGKVAAKGVEKTPEEAEKQADKAIIALVNKGQANGEKKRDHRSRVRYHMERRTHCTIGFCQMLLGGITDKARVIQEAEEWERAAWEQDELKDKAPLPQDREERRGRQPLTAGEVAAQLWESMSILGWIDEDMETGHVKVTGKLKKWAHEMFGEEMFK